VRGLTFDVVAALTYFVVVVPVDLQLLGPARCNLKQAATLRGRGDACGRHTHPLLWPCPSRQVPGDWRVAAWQVLSGAAPC
jgi:hypothetical protein